MSSIGPQLPPHLAKRKRSLDETDDPASPPAKLPTIHGPSLPNREEISLDDDDSSEDGFGPSASTAPSIGPLPPKPQQEDPQNEEEIPLDPDSDPDPEPTGPPPPSEHPPPRRIIGPAMPPSNPTAEDSDSSDDDYGPALPGQSRAAPAPLPTSTSYDDVSPAPKRDDWMLAPPTAGSARAPDPTKLRNRGFATGRAAASSAGKGQGIASIWTETASEKLTRLQNTVLGRDDPSAAQPTTSTGATHKPSREDEEQRRRIESYTAQTRGQSLYEENRAARRAGRSVGRREDEDDPSQRGFDREKDMALGGKIGAKKKKEMLDKAAGFGDRFAKGSYL